MRYQIWRDQVKATEKCLWCDEVLEGIGATQELARATLAKACAEHQCQAKRERNLRRGQVTA